VWSDKRARLCAWAASALADRPKYFGFPQVWNQQSRQNSAITGGRRFPHMFLTLHGVELTPRAATREGSPHSYPRCSKPLQQGRFARQLLAGLISTGEDIVLKLSRIC
jgi:hypothetical protein